MTVELHPLAFQNAALMHELIKTGADRAETGAELAARIGRDKSNLSKTLKALADAGLVDADDRGLTDAGVEQYEAILRAEGQTSGDAADGPLRLRPDQIRPDPHQVRADWDSEDAVADLKALAEDIADRGLLQDPIVRSDGQGGWLLVGGERRWRAVRLLQAEGRLPADHLMTCKVREPRDEIDNRLAALAENLQRRALNPIEEANAYRGLRDAGLTTEQIAQRVSMTQRHVQSRLQLLEHLTPDQQRRMTLPADDDKRLSVSEARKLVANAEAKRKAREKAEADWTPRQRLILAEIRAAGGDGYIYAVVEVDGLAMHADADAEALDKAGILNIPTNRNLDGKTFTRCDGKAWDVCTALFPDGAAAYATALRAEMGLPEPEAGRFSTDWLNGPFELTDGVKADVERAAAERAAQHAERKRQSEAAAAERKARDERAALTRVHAEALLAKAATAPAAPLLDGVPVIAQGVERPLPWVATVDAEVLDANGVRVLTCSPGWQAVTDAEISLAMMTAVAVNTAAGLETPPLLTEDPQSDDEEADETADAEADPDDGEDE